MTHMLPGSSVNRYLLEGIYQNFQAIIGPSGYILEQKAS